MIIRSCFKGIAFRKSYWRIFLKIAIVDDESIYLNQLNEMICSQLNTLGIHSVPRLFHSADEFLRSWKPGEYHLIFLDIFIDEDNGIDVARKIRETDEEVTLVFCTTSNEFAAQSYEVDARYYLHKPITEEKVATMLKRVNLSRLERDQIIQLPDGYKCILYSILYTNYLNHYVQFHLGSHQLHNVYMSHADAEKLLLDHPGFCTVNKGSIVNFRAVEKIGKTDFLLKNGESIPISHRRYKAVSEAYTDFKFRELKSML